MITVTGEYALRAMAGIARHPQGTYVLAKDLSQSLDIPPNYLSKVLQLLARAGLLESTRGRNGGFRMSRKPTTIFLYDILAAVEPMKRYEICILGNKECSDATACPIHHTWKEARGRVMTMFRQTPLTKLVEHQSDILGKVTAGKRRA